MSRIKCFTGASKKGYAPYNAKKRNQDAFFAETHTQSGSALFGVFDGHGEDGDLISNFFSAHLPAAIFSSSEFVREPGSVIGRELLACEQNMLKGA